MIKRRTTAPRSIGAGNRCFEIGSELPEIDEAFDALQIVAFGGQFPQTLINVEEPRHPSHHVRAPLQRQRIESGRRRFGYCFWRRPATPKGSRRTLAVKFTKAKPREDCSTSPVDLAIPVFGYQNHISID